MSLDLLLAFCQASGNVPIKEWLDELKKTEPKAYAKCLELITSLVQLGNELRPPRAKILRDGIWELRARRGKVHYRMLYFFCGKAVACLSHGFKKGGKGDSESPEAEIEEAIKNRSLVSTDRERYTASWGSLS